TIEGIAGEGNAFAENLFRLTGDWMQGTEVRVPERRLATGTTEIAGRRLRLLALDGHTGADLAIYDETSGVLFAGDLAFLDRAPTTPHADIGRWLAALDRLEAITREPGFTGLLPGHGPLARDAAPLRQTRAWLAWLQGALRRAADDGLDMNEVLARPLPAEFAALPVAAGEYRRSVSHLFPAIEQEILGAGR
ncbi:MAG TPA: MBL fold metallo-hydrolase, partial [Azonexus sp.]